MSARTATERDQLFAALDRDWRTACELADLSGTGRRQAGARLAALVRAGVAEMRETGAAPSPWSDKPPREYRRAW